MKKILLGLLLVSISVSASTNLTDDQKNVIQAIDKSLYSAKLSCTEFISGQTFPSSKVLVKPYLQTNVKMNINELNEPSIQFASFFVLESVSVNIEISTSDDFMNVIEMHLTMTQDIAGKEINNGTLTRPNFKKESSPKIIADYLCR